METERERQMREAEELLGEHRSRSFAKGLFFGRFEKELAWPYPAQALREKTETDAFLERVREFINREVDSYRIDQESRVPEEVLRGLFELGVMSMSIPREFGGLGFSQQAYCRVMEVFGAEDASLAVLINAHEGLCYLRQFGPVTSY